MNVTFKKDEYVLLDDTNKIIANYIVTKGAKGDTGAGEDNIIEDVKVNNNSLPVTSKSVNIDLTGYVEKETGKGLSTNDYTTTEKNKLAGIEASADVNIIENIKVNGVAQTVTNKAVDISVPVNTSDLNNDSDFVTSTDLASHIVNVGTEVDEDYRVNFIKSKNLFDKVKASNSNNYNTTLGNYVGMAIQLKPNTKYTISRFVSGTVASDSSYNLDMRLYESSGTPIFYLNNYGQIPTITNDSITITIGASGILYIAGRYIDNTKLSTLFSKVNVQIEEGETATSYEPMQPNQIVVDNEKYTDTLNVGTSLDSRSRVNVLKSKNKVQTNNIYMQYGINDVNGSLASNQPTRVCIFQVKVKPNTQYTISCANGYLIGNVFQYNESKTYTTKVETDYARSKQYTSNSTTHYISFVLRNSDNTTIPTSEINNIKVQVEEGTETAYEPYVTPSINVDGEEIYQQLQYGKGNLTHSSISYGDAFYHKLGNLVIVNIQDLQVSTAITDNTAKLGEGFPKNSSDANHIAQFGVLENYNNGSTAYTIRVIVNTSGELHLNYSSIPTSQRFYGTFVYITNE